MREKILTFIEKNSRVNLKDLAVMLGVEEAVVANEIADMEKEGIICVRGGSLPTVCFSLHFNKKKKKIYIVNR